MLQSNINYAEQKSRMQDFYISIPLLSVLLVIFHQWDNDEYSDPLFCLETTVNLQEVQSDYFLGLNWRGQPNPGMNTLLMKLNEKYQTKVTS